MCKGADSHTHELREGVRGQVRVMRTAVSRWAIRSVYLFSYSISPDSDWHLHVLQQRLDSKIIAPVGERGENL